MDTGLSPKQVSRLSIALTINGRPIAIVPADRCPSARSATDRLVEAYQEITAITSAPAIIATPSQTPITAKVANIEQEMVKTPSGTLLARRTIPLRPIGPTTNDYAQKVLREAGRGLTLAELTERMLVAGWKTSSSSPRRQRSNVSASVKKADDRFHTDGTLYFLRNIDASENIR